MDTNINKTIYVILGCNGSGKTNYYYSQLSDLFGDIPYINTDDISKKLQNEGTSRLSANLQSSYKAFQMIDNLLNENKSFVFEALFIDNSVMGTTKVLKEIRKKFGYKINGFFVHTGDVRKNISNVIERTAKGIGQYIEPMVILDRYNKTLENIKEDCYCFDELTIINNSEFQFKEMITLNKDELNPIMIENFFIKGIKSFDEFLKSFNYKSVKEAREKYLEYIKNL